MWIRRHLPASFLLLQPSTNQAMHMKQTLSLFVLLLSFLNGYAQNEELVDWIARQGPKLYRAWAEAGAL